MKGNDIAKIAVFDVQRRDPKGRPEAGEQLRADTKAGRKRICQPGKKPIPSHNTEKNDK